MLPDIIEFIASEPLADEDEYTNRVGSISTFNGVEYRLTAQDITGREVYTRVDTEEES